MDKNCGSCKWWDSDNNELGMCAYIIPLRLPSAYDRVKTYRWECEYCPAYEPKHG